MLGVPFLRLSRVKKEMNFLLTERIMDNSRVISMLQEVIGILSGGELKDPVIFPDVFDLQPSGYTRLGAVESFRLELRAKNEPLASRFAELLPEWWYVQDAEDYVPMTTEQQQLQEFNCGNARFTMSIMGQSASGNHLWRKWWPAVRRGWSEAAQGFVDTPIEHEGKKVYAVANDSRNPGGRVLSTNPRVADMAKVVRNAYNYFYATNKDANIPLSSLGY